jgi:hypothetical protein
VWVEHTVGSKLDGGVPQLSNSRARATDPGQAGYLLGDCCHLGTGLEIALPRPTIDVADVERDQPADRVENVGDRGVCSVNVPNIVGEHGGNLLGVGEPKHLGRKAG